MLKRFSIGFILLIVGSLFYVGTKAQSPNGTTCASTASPACSLTDGSGNVWSFQAGTNPYGTGPYILKNGTIAAGGAGVLLEYVNTIIWVKNGNGAWYNWSGTAWVAQSNGPPATAAPPVITQQPANQSVTVGQTATFTVAATGTPTPTYQWSKNGTSISAATGTSYTTPATVSTDNGAMFTATVTNSGGSVVSRAATLSVAQPPPSFTVTPSSLTFTMQSVNTISTGGVVVKNNGSTAITFSVLEVSEFTGTAGAVDWGMYPALVGLNQYAPGNLWTLQPGASSNFIIIFWPKKTGTITGNVNITSGSQSVAVPLTGTAQ